MNAETQASSCAFITIILLRVVGRNGRRRVVVKPTSRLGSLVTDYCVVGHHPVYYWAYWGLGERKCFLYHYRSSSGGDFLLLLLLVYFYLWCTIIIHPYYFMYYSIFV